MRKARKLKRQIPLHLMMVPGVVLLLIFAYLPMGGLTIAFQKFNPAKGFFGNQTWVGLDNFKFILSMPNIWRVVWNTFYISSLKIIMGMVVPIIFALMLNEIRNRTFKRSVQTIVYFPNFLSWIILGGIMIDILSPSSGILNQFLGWFGVQPIFFLGDKSWFPITMVLSDTWKSFGFGTVIYLASITSIDLELYQAAAIDGAGRWKQTLHITLPGMRMIVVLLMVLNLGNVLNAGFDQIFNLYSPAVFETGDIIDTLVYRLGLQQVQYGPSTAVGLLKSGVSFVLIGSSYYVADRFFGYSIF